MIFSSYEFIFGFLPVVFFGYLGLSLLRNQTASKLWLVLASLFFYGFWNWNYLYLIGGSIGVNFALSRWQLGAAEKHKKLILVFAIVFNLALLSYFKYLNFFFDTVGWLTGGYQIEKILLPIGLSFYTFQQISYQVDCYTQRSGKYNLLDYALFVSFFPQLIAGPIVHHREMMSQFVRTTFLKPRAKLILVGLCLFSVGLFKKSVLADSFAGFANPVFAAGLDPETALTAAGAWAGTVSYGLQLYFDFSGYSDMAVGLGMIFGIKLPHNFFSPLKAKNMIGFWQRWHMTLTREVTNLLYYPISIRIMRKTMRLDIGKLLGFVVSVALPTLLVWMIVGLWHGAGWTFIWMGLAFGACIAANHFTNTFVYKNTKTPVLRSITRLPAWLSIGFTVLAYFLIVVLFRAENMKAAQAVYAAMFGFGDAFGSAAKYVSLPKQMDWLWFIAGFAIVWLLPNSVQVFARYRAGLNIFGHKVSRPYSKLSFRLSVLPVFICALMMMAGLIFIAESVAEFIYFDF